MAIKSARSIDPVREINIFFHKSNEIISIINHFIYPILIISMEF